MKHAIARLTRDLETLAHNESIARGEDRTTDADNLAAEASDVRSALDVLKCISPDNGITPYTQLVQVLNIDASFDGVIMDAAVHIHELREKLASEIASGSHSRPDQVTESPLIALLLDHLKGTTVRPEHTELTATVRITDKGNSVYVASTGATLDPAVDPPEEPDLIWQLMHRFDRSRSEVVASLAFIDRFPDTGTWQSPAALQYAGQLKDGFMPEEWMKHLLPEDDGYLTFEQFVQHGIDQGAPLTRGMPWSFNFHGFPVTHETDDRYLVGSEIQFRRGEHIRVLDGTITVKP